MRREKVQTTKARIRKALKKLLEANAKDPDANPLTAESIIALAVAGGHGGNINTIEWLNGTTPIPKADIEAKMAELPTAEEERIARENLKASAKAKLIAGQPLTEEEADTIVL